MKNKRTTKIILGGLAAVSLMAINPIQASAEWKKDNIGWWYTEGNSYLRNCTRYINEIPYFFDEDGYLKTGWVENIDSYGDNEWYYYYSDGTLAKDTVIDGYVISTSGNMLEDVTQSDVEYYRNIMYQNIDFEGDIFAGGSYEEGCKIKKNLTIPAFRGFYSSRAIIFYMRDNGQELDPQQCIVDMDNNRVYMLDTGLNLCEYKNKKIVKRYTLTY